MSMFSFLFIYSLSLLFAHFCNQNNTKNTSKNEVIVSLSLFLPVYFLILRFYFRCNFFYPIVLYQKPGILLFHNTIWLLLLFLLYFIVPFEFLFYSLFSNVLYPFNVFLVIVFRFMHTHFTYSQ